MKKNKLTCKYIILTLSTMLLIGSSSLFPVINAHAEHEVSASVHGTVKSGTNSSILYLKTTEGDMTIKLDSDTDTSNCKLMLPGSVIYADLYYGSDAYMHAAKLSATAVGSSAKSATVTGTIKDKAIKDNVMFVSTSDGEMKVKLDATTKYSGGVLCAGKTITMEVVRGDDAYMHALSISDNSSVYSADTTANTYTEITASPSVSANASTDTKTNTTETADTKTNTATATDTKTDTTAATDTKTNTTETVSVETAPTVSTTAITGTVGKSSKAGKLYLSTDAGTYEIKLDANTSYSNGFLAIEGKKITANIYRGSDAYMHAASLSRVKKQAAASSSNGDTYSFTGTVSGDTTEDTLQLKTSGGTMKIKLDANTKYESSTPVFKGSSVTVSCVVCADEYWHATSLKLN